jgi:hypothetical protein
MSVSIRSDVPWQGQGCYVIETDMAAYYLHEEGAGLASLFDRQGHDWISYRPGGGSAGEYRGIPNCGTAFHPGYTRTTPGKRGCETVVEVDRPNYARLVSTSSDGQWKGIWHFGPAFARFSMVRAAAAYWFLYEGTPGGKLDLERDYYLMPDGRQRPITEDWAGQVPEPRWVCFGKKELSRRLFLVHHGSPELQVKDQMWQMEGNMTVWGFGRIRRPLQPLLTMPAHLTVGFTEESDARLPDAISAAADQTVY